MRAQRVELGQMLVPPRAARFSVDPGRLQAVVGEGAQVIQAKAEVAHHHAPGAGGRDVVQRRVVGVGVHAQAQGGHAANRVVQRPALGRQRAQVVGVGGHHGEDDARVGALARKVRRIDHRVAVVDAVDLEQLDRRAHVGPGHAELAGVGGGLQPGLARGAVGIRKQLGRAVVLAVVDADAHHLLAGLGDDPLHHLQRGFG